jgi:hypothetical protein
MLREEEGLMDHIHGIAGKGAREMANSRHIKAAILAGILLVVGLLMLTNLNRIAKMGLPAVIVLVLLVRVGGDHIEKRALHFKKRAKDADRGAEAEEKVAFKLEQLPEGYHAFHDVAFDGFNIDHIVVGPGGIFLVETKSHRGKIDAKGDTLLLNGKPPMKDFLKQTWSQTFHLKEFLWKMTSKEWDVKPVLCFTNAYVAVRRPVKGIAINNIKYLNKYLSQQPPTLPPEDVAHVAKVMSCWISPTKVREG